MKESLSHLPEHKRNELEKLVGIITKMINAEFVVLFGSYARGDWVEDKSIGEDGNLYEYRSDYDILIVVKNPRRYERNNFPQRIKEKARRIGVCTSASMIFHSPAEFKRAVNKGKYFFVDIINDGILLHASGRTPLPEIEELSIKEQRSYAQEDFDNWFQGAKVFYENYEYNIGKGDIRKYLNNAAFQLHQAAEYFYTTVMLVFTGYKPKLHDLEELGAKVQMFSSGFRDIFPRTTKREKDLFDLLKRAYVEARYSMSYAITREELEYLAERVKQLQTVTERACKEKIQSLKDAE
ncbi:MAG: HEPN domain-containing protein [Victivallales bacterium]|nr:HEPN domain-containing protein [Victivallales bacterium]